MAQQSKIRMVWDGLEAVIPFVFPALGGLFGVVYVNLHKMDQLNPMFWIGGGIIAGFIAARFASFLLTRIR